MKAKMYVANLSYMEMESQADVQKAISMFNGYSLNERPLTMNVARPREERGGNHDSRSD